MCNACVRVCVLCVVLLPVVAYLPASLSSSSSSPPPSPPSPRALLFPLQTFLLTSSDSAWKEVKGEKKNNKEKKKKDGIYSSPTLLLSLPPLSPSKALSHNLTRQTAGYCEDKCSLLSLTTQFLFLSLLLPMINRMNYYRALDGAKSNLDYQIWLGSAFYSFMLIIFMHLCSAAQKKVLACCTCACQIILCMCVCARRLICLSICGRWESISGLWSRAWL